MLPSCASASRRHQHIATAARADDRHERRELVIGGMSDAKILRVVGLAAAAHLDRKDPFNPINRRISIIVMNKATEEAVLHDGVSLDVPEQGGAAKAAARRQQARRFIATCYRASPAPWVMLKSTITRR